VDLPCIGHAPFVAFARLGRFAFGATPCGGVARVDLDDLALGEGGWSPSGSGLPLDARVTDLEVLDGIIYASLALANSPNAPTGVYASADEGLTWQPIGPAYADHPNSSLAVASGTLFAGTQSQGVWRLKQACPADFNGDGFLNPDDLTDLITCLFLEIQFPATCPQADFNADAFTNPDDLSDYITAFFLGC
jgi:hypothetical protein